MHVYAELTPLFDVTQAVSEPADSRPVLLLAVDAADQERYPSGMYTLLAAQTTIEATQLIERFRPRVVAIDWDLPTLDGAEVCRAASRSSATSVLVTTGVPAHAPAAIRAGCHAVLLKPFPRNLAAARLGRLVRETSLRPTKIPVRDLQWHGTNRTWPETPCVKCGTGGATSFEFSSHRRMWYACLACDAVWLGARQE